MPLSTSPLKPDFLWWAEHWYDSGYEDGMWRCLLRWASGIDRLE